jgi:hypothetical protein
MGCVDDIEKGISTRRRTRRKYMDSRRKEVMPMISSRSTFMDLDN